MGFKGFLKGCQAPFFMILIQLFTTGMMLLSKLVLVRGAFIFSLLTYRHLVAALILAPFAFFIERGMEKKLSWAALFWIFLNGLFGITMGMGLYYYGLRATSATFASNFLNLIPIATFVFSTIVGLEKLGLNSMGGRVKIAGTVFCVAGATIISLYRGKSLPLHIWPSYVHNHANCTNKAANTSHPALGCLLLIGSCLGYATWFIIQVKLFKVFQSTYWATMLSCLAGCIQSAIIGISIERGKAAWRLGWDLNLLTIVYSGVLNTAVSFCFISWTVAHRGPTYPPMFNPLALIFVTILESFFMGEELFVGSILGMILIIGGLYGFLWGKRNQLQPSDANVGGGDVVLVPGSTHSSGRIAPLSLGDVASVLDSSQLSSKITPIFEHQTGMTLGEAFKKEAECQCK